MTHANAPLTPEGRLRLVQRCHSGPIAHVAAEAGVARATVTKWVHRYDKHGREGIAAIIAMQSLLSTTLESDADATLENEATGSCC